MVTGPQARLDMGDRDSSVERGLGCSERARRVALDDDKRRRRDELCAERPADLGDMCVGVRTAGAVEVDSPQMPEVEFVRIERRVLAGQREHAVEPVLGERGSDR